MADKACPHCGTLLQRRLGSYQCPSCGYDEYSANTGSALAAESAPLREQPATILGPERAAQPMAMLTERWLLFAAGLVVYVAGCAVPWLVLCSPHGLGEQGAVVLIWLWPWLITWILAWLLGHFGIVLSILLIAALQALVLFTTSIPARYAAVVFVAAFTLWFALYLLPLAAALFTGRWFWIWFWILLAPVAIGIWGIVFLIRDIRRLRELQKRAVDFDERTD